MIITDISLLMLHVLIYFIHEIIGTRLIRKNTCFIDSIIS